MAAFKGAIFKYNHLYMELPMITAQEAAAYIQHQDIVALGGFAPSGTPKAIVLAIADKARKEHEQDRPFRINLLTGASIADSSDGALAEAEADFPFVPAVPYALPTIRER